jgi:hypothetical protein
MIRGHELIMKDFLLSFGKCSTFFSSTNSRKKIIVSGRMSAAGFGFSERLGFKPPQPDRIGKDKWLMDMWKKKKF